MNERWRSLELATPDISPSLRRSRTKRSCMRQRPGLCGCRCGSAQRRGQLRHCWRRLHRGHQHLRRVRAGSDRSGPEAVCTIPGEGIHGLITAYMQIASGVADVVTVEAHSKASNVLTLPYITAYAMDPVLNRPLAANPVFISRYGDEPFPVTRPGATREQCAHVVVKNKRNALRQPAGRLRRHGQPR